MTLYESVLSSMQEKVRSGEWAQGNLIPREMDLCTQYGVSRSTIRMAMSRMVSDGLLTRVKGVGTYVTHAEYLQATTLFLSSFARDLESRGINVCTELLSFCMVPAVPHVNQKLDLPSDARLLRITRLRYPQDAFDKGPLVLTTSYFPAALQEKLQNYDLEKTPLYRALQDNGYERRTSDKYLSAQVLTARECHLMGVEPGALAISISSTAWDQHSHPLEYTSSLYPISKNVFELRVKC